MTPEFRKSLWVALADTLGFILGFIAGRMAGEALGFDFFKGTTNWDLHAIIGLVFVLAGAGLGRMLFRWLFARLGKI